MGAQGVADDLLQRRRTVVDGSVLTVAGHETVGPCRRGDRVVETPVGVVTCGGAAGALAERKPVDETGDGDPAPGDLRRQSLSSGGRGEVERNSRGSEAVLRGQFGGQCLQPVGPSSDKHEVRAALGEPPGELRAQAGLAPVISVVWVR